MDILNQAEIVLRQAGYDTWPWSGGRVAVICFENVSLIGFLHVFPTAEMLVGQWDEAQRIALARFAPALKLCGAKAWNVYSVFLTEDEATPLIKPIEQLEENFSLTRKIARSSVRSAAQLQEALLPFLPILSQPTLDQTDFGQRLRLRLKELPISAVTAFVSAGRPRDIVEMLEATP